jgi:murein tripeptide amidase MpaA
VVAKSAGVEVENFIEFFRDPPEEAQLKTLAWNDGELDGEGLVDWTPFEHPQLGRVEMGGWKTKFTAQNPPPKFLRAECEKLTRFALSHAQAAPRLEARLGTEELSLELKRLELTVENTGYLPTNVTRIAADKKLVKPVEVEMTLPEGMSLVSGETEVDPGHLSGRSALLDNRWKNAGWYGSCGAGVGGIEVRAEKAGTVRLESG